MDYEKITEKDLGEEVKFKFSKKAFETEKIYCSSCKCRAKKVLVEIALPESDLLLRYYVFRCSKCNKEYLNFKEASKLDRALVMNNLLLEKSVGFERALNYDGESRFVRLPIELTRTVSKKAKVIINPLSSEEFLLRIKAKLL